MSDLLHILRREFVYLWYYFDLQLRQIFWYWVLGIAIGSFISVFFKDGTPFERTTHLLWREEASRLPQVRAFIDMVSENAAAR